jgi:hypothetical protein
MFLIGLFPFFYALPYSSSFILFSVLSALTFGSLCLWVSISSPPLFLPQVDKKVADGKLRLILLKGELGNCVFTGDFDSTKLQETLEFFCEA